MISVEYTADFLRKYKKLSSSVKSEVKQRIEEFRNINNHSKLKVHKLKGVMRGQCAFSINYHDRIVFEWSRDKKTAYILDVGDHSIYE